MSDFEIVPRDEGKPDPKEDQPSTLSILETIAGWFGEVVLGFIKGVGMVFSGIALGAIKFTEMIVDTAKMLANGIADAILGKGGEMQEIAGAVDKKLEPYDNAITENARYFGELSHKVDEAIIAQEGLIEEQEQLVKKADTYVASAEKARKELAEFEENRRKDVRKLTEDAEAAAKEAEEFRQARVNAEKQISQEVAAALRAAESAQESADGKSTIYYGSNTPKSPKDGDTWFKPVAGGTQIQVLENGKWVNRSDTAEFDKSLKANAQAIKNLTEVELPKISASTAGFNQALASEKAAREKALKTLGTKLDGADKDLERLGTARPGNVWPDPHFKDPCWVGDGHRWINPNNNGGELTFRANGKQIGMYYQPQGKHDKGLMLERGAKYLLTATVWRDENLPDKTTISVHMRQNGKWVVAVGRLPTGPVGVSVESVILDIPNNIGGGGSTLGFFIESNVPKGAASIWDVQIVRAADDAMIIDGAVTAAKVHAGAIDTNHLAADAVKAGKIASDAVSARELKSDSVYAKHIVANEITGDKLKADAITSREVKSNSIMAEHLVIGGPANMIANGGFTEGAEPWDKALHMQNIDESQKLPPGNRYAITKPGQSTIAAHTGNQWFAVTPNSMYAFEIWMWADKPGSRFFLELRNQYGRHAGKALWDKVNSADINAGTGDYLMNNIEIRQGWNKYSTVYQTGKDSTRARLGGFYFNHSNGKERNVRIAFTGVSLRPMADADLIVDGSILAQHIKADQITGREIKSGTINADQLVVDKGFIKTAMIGDSQITSAKISELDAGKIKTGELDGQRIKADSITVKELRANSIVPIGGSLIAHEPPPSDTTKPPEPIWWQVCGHELPASYGGYPRPEGNPWRMHWEAQGVYKAPRPLRRLVKVKPGQKYRLQFWCRATKPNTKMFIEMRDQNGAHAVKSGAVSGNVKVGNFQTAKEAKQPWPVTDFSKSTVGTYLVNSFTLPTDITKVTSIIEFKEGVEYVYLDGFHFNHSNGSEKGDQWLAGLSLELDIPDQAQVDAVQTKAIEANTTAIKMLGRVDIGSSLLPFVPPSEKDLADPNKKVDWTIPAWTVPFKVMGTVSLDGVTRPYYGFRRPNTPVDYKELPKIPVPVNPSIPYRVTAWVYSTEDYAGAWFQLGAKIAGTSTDAIKEARAFNEFDRDGNRFYTNKGSKPTLRFKPDRSPRGWNKVEAQVTFKSGVESITWDDITFGNLPNYDAKGEVFFAHLQVVPDVPTQEEIDARQNIAINALADAAAANASFNRQQKNINRLVEEQLWQHQDMIELLEIRSLKQYGMRGSTSGTRTLSRPFFDAYHSSNSPNVVTVECKGNWVGTIHVLANTGGSLKGGLVDDYICNVTDNIRRFRIVGGGTVEFRHITFQVSIESLKREVILDPKNKKVIDTEGLVRSVTLTNGKTVDATGWNKTYTNVEAFRLRNGSTFRDGTGTFTYENVVGEKRTWETTSTLPSMMFPLDVFSSVNGRVTLVEADDSNKMYSVPGTKKNLPANTQTLSY